MTHATPGAPARSPRLFYGWIVVGIAFVTMGVAVTARTGFSLLFPEIVAEFGWDSGLTAGAFSVGFVASTAFLPVVGWLMSRWGPQVTIPVGAALVAGGYLAATQIATPLQLYLAFGVLAVNGSMAMSYISHSMFLPNWFVRNRGLAVGLAFAGVGAAGITLLPAMQWLIETQGWRAACLAVAAITAVVLIPLNALFQRSRPEAMGLLPDGDAQALPGAAPRNADTVVDPGWAHRDWTLPLALRTARFWWFTLAFFCSLFIWYAIQIHQTRFLISSGFPPRLAALALGMVAFCGIFGQIALGALSDRLGREIGWTLATLGYALTSLLLMAIDQAPSALLLWAMVAAQGLLGNGLAAIFGAAAAELFQSRRFPAIFTAMSVLGNFGAASGAWAMGEIHDLTGDYVAGFQLCLALSLLSMLAMWLAAPRKVRLVSGRARARARA